MIHSPSYFALRASQFIAASIQCQSHSLLILYIVFFELIGRKCFSISISQFCTDPPVLIPNGIVLHYGTTKYQCCGYFGDITYACKNGYELSGSPTVKCHNSKWSELPRCIKLKRCDIPLYALEIEHVEIIRERIMVDKTDMDSVIPGSFILMKCKNDFKWQNTSGPLNFTCQYNGNWTEPPICKPSKALCHKSTIPSLTNGVMISEDLLVLGEIYDYYKEGSSIKYKCEENFVAANGNPYILVECISNRTWFNHSYCRMSQSHPALKRCKLQPPVPSLTAKMIENNLLKYDDGTFDGFYRFQCIDEVEYEPLLSEKESNYVRCIDSIWTGQPICKPKPVCDLGELFSMLPGRHTFYLTENKLAYSKYKSSSVLTGSTIKIQCMSGFMHSPDSGSIVITCLRSGNWSRTPVCLQEHLVTTEYFPNYQSTDYGILSGDDLSKFLHTSTAVNEIRSNNRYKVINQKVSNILSDEYNQTIEANHQKRQLQNQYHSLSVLNPYIYTTKQKNKSLSHEENDGILEQIKNISTVSEKEDIQSFSPRIELDKNISDSNYENSINPLYLLSSSEEQFSQNDLKYGLSTADQRNSNREKYKSINLSFPSNLPSNVTEKTYTQKITEISNDTFNLSDQNADVGFDEIDFIKMQKNTDKAHHIFSHNLVPVMLTTKIALKPEVFTDEMDVVSETTTVATFETEFFPLSEVEYLSNDHISNLSKLNIVKGIGVKKGLNTSQYFYADISTNKIQTERDIVTLANKPLDSINFTEDYDVQILANTHIPKSNNITHYYYRSELKESIVEKNVENISEDLTAEVTKNQLMNIIGNITENSENVHQKQLSFKLDKSTNYSTNLSDNSIIEDAKIVQNTTKVTMRQVAAHFTDEYSAQLKNLNDSSDNIFDYLTGNLSSVKGTTQRVDTYYKGLKSYVFSSSTPSTEYYNGDCNKDSKCIRNSSNDFIIKDTLINQISSLDDKNHFITQMYTDNSRYKEDDKMLNLSSDHNETNASTDDVDNRNAGSATVNLIIDDNLIRQTLINIINLKGILNVARNLSEFIQENKDDFDKPEDSQINDILITTDNQPFELYAIQKPGNLLYVPLNETEIIV
ncbi:hypothetical protein GJ496_009275 [Pomphorhynchus laevis]|nr:hypothetical protein GJ496_009275 [Pomphorhynchus laevis]